MYALIAYYILYCLHFIDIINVSFWFGFMAGVEHYKIDEV